MIGNGISVLPMSFFIQQVDFTASRDNCFPCGLVLLRVTTSVSQFSRRDPSNNNASTSSASGTSRDMVCLISPWKAFRCSTMLESLQYLSLTIFLKKETMFTAFLFSNMNPVFFQSTLAFVCSSQSLYRVMSVKHLMYAAAFKCMTSQVEASILPCLLFSNYTCNHRSLYTSMFLILDFQTE